MNCTGFAENFTTIIECFQQIGWSVRNSYGEIEYLNKKDSDYFWKCDGMSDERFYEMISNKEKNEDQIGVNLFHRDGNEGISLIGFDPNEVILSLTIHRKKVRSNHTDVIWYIENIIFKLWDVGARILWYRFEEIED